MFSLELFKAVVLGHAVGDAIGVPVEFKDRESLKVNPVTEMMGYGTYPVPKGCWSDDTSTSLATLDVLSRGYCDFDEIMFNFGRWYFKDEFTPTGKTFDVGNTCSSAIKRYFIEGKSSVECGLSGAYENGNGSLMRIYPVALYCLAKEKSLNTASLKLIYQASSLTHAHSRSKVGCAVYACVLEALLKAPIKSSVSLGLDKARTMLQNEVEFSFYERVYEEDFTNFEEEKIKSSGYVVDTLEAALWCLLNTSSYVECVLKAVNLGDDTDTVGAVAGSLAGALYGLEAIPTEWINSLQRKEYFITLCETAYKAWNKPE